MKQHIYSQIPALLFVVVSIGLFFWQTPVDYISSLIEGRNIESFIFFVALLAFATIFMPVTVVPVIPLAATILGPFTTSVLSVIGWTLGGVGAFLVARYLGRPFISNFVSLKSVDKAAEKIPQDMQFLTIIILRLTLPVDVISYVVGLSSSISLLRYTVATAIGVTYFSFAFAYLGDAFFRGDFALIPLVGGFSLLVFLAAWFILWRSRKNSDKEE